MALRYFPNAKIVANKIHYAKYATEMIDTIRKEMQNKLDRKERLLDIIHMQDKEKATKLLNEWIVRCSMFEYEEIRNCAKTYANKIVEIRNSLAVLYSNGPLEGYNNKIKTLKRTAFGFRNFTNFKARILLMSS